MAFGVKMLFCTASATVAMYFQHICGSRERAYWLAAMLTLLQVELCTVKPRSYNMPCLTHLDHRVLYVVLCASTREAIRIWLNAKYSVAVVQQKLKDLDHRLQHAAVSGIARIKLK